MKQLLALLFLILMLPFSVNASDVYYCSDDNHVGFETTKNYEITRYTPKKFKIMIDFENNNVISDKIWFLKESDSSCIKYSNVLYCINNYGAVFAINKKSLKFFRSSVTNGPEPLDDPTLAYGTCEKF
jgi:hypothetical protein